MSFKPREFYGQVKEELSKVSWPSSENTITTSAVVVVVVGMITIYLGVIDAIVSKLAQLIIG